MFDSPRFLNTKVFTEVLSKFEWPEPFTIQDESPDGIILSFERSNFVFSESPDGDVVVGFLSEDTKCDLSLHIGHAMSIVVPESSRINGIATPGLIDEGMPFPSQEKVENSIHNAFTIILTHLQHVIQGDYSWVAEYLHQREERRLKVEEQRIKGQRRS